MASIEDSNLNESAVGEIQADVEKSGAGDNGAGSAVDESCSTGRFRFFIIDTGWKSSSAKVIRDNFAMIRHHQEEGDSLYVLSREQSLSLVKNHPEMIGKDPIILVRDLHVHKDFEDDYHGFRLNLGIITNGDAALDALQRFLRFVSLHRRSSDIERDIQDKLHRDGMKGLVEILHAGSKDIVGG